MLMAGRANRCPWMNRLRTASTGRCHLATQGEPFPQASSSLTLKNNSYPTTWAPEVSLSVPYLLARPPLVDEVLRLDAHILCEIESDLSTADETKFKEKNRRFWSLGKHYFKVDYEVKVLIGPADVRFELCKTPSPILSLSVVLG